MIGAQRLLGIGATVRIIEKRLRHAALVQLAQILDAGDVLHGRSRPFFLFLLRQKPSWCEEARNAPSPDDASHRLENHEAPLSAASFETRARALLRTRGESGS